jgi:hypothetical protein
MATACDAVTMVAAAKAGSYFASSWEETQTHTPFK